MRGIIGYGAYVPRHRLQRATAGEILGTRGGRGTRAVSSYDEDTNTMGVEAARRAVASSGVQPGAVWFATSNPTYVDKTNATTIHAALQLERTAPALDFGGAVRSGLGALSMALESTRSSVMVVSSDVRGGLPTSGDELAAGDAASALMVGDHTDDQPVLAEVVGSASTSEEFFDAWRLPGEIRTKHWEERFGETRYQPLANEAFAAALADAGVEQGDLAHVAVVGLHTRAIARTIKGWKLGEGVEVDNLASTVGNTGTAHAGLLLTATLERADPGALIALVGLSDGVDVLILRATDAIAEYEPVSSVADQVAAGNDSLTYATYLAWRGQITKEPPRRPGPARMSAPAASRTSDWKYAFVGSRDRESGAVHMPPARVSFDGGAFDDMETAPMADAQGTIVTFTVDRIAYSPSPPVVFGVIDFDGGGRLPMELTDVDAEAIAIGDRVEMTFRVLNTADWLTNYFWKARPLPA